MDTEHQTTQYCIAQYAHRRPWCRCRLLQLHRCPLALAHPKRVTCKGRVPCMLGSRSTRRRRQAVRPTTLRGGQAAAAAVNASPCVEKSHVHTLLQQKWCNWSQRRTFNFRSYCSVQVPGHVDAHAYTHKSGCVRARGSHTGSRNNRVAATRAKGIAYSAHAAGKGKAVVRATYD